MSRWASFTGAKTAYRMTINRQDDELSEGTMHELSDVRVKMRLWLPDKLPEDTSGHLMDNNFTRNFKIWAACS